MSNFITRQRPGRPLIAEQDLTNEVIARIDFEEANWNTAAKHKLFVVSGPIHFRLLAHCTEDLNSAGAAVLKGIGPSSDSAGWFGTGSAHEYDSIDAGFFLPKAGGTAPAKTFAVIGNLVYEGVIADNSIIYEIGTAALTDGNIDFILAYEPIAPGARVTAGDGSAP